MTAPDVLQVLVDAFTGAVSDTRTDYVWAGAFGALIGSAELVARYRDSPWQAVRSVPGYAYVGINAAAAVLALGAIRVFDFAPTIGDAGDPVAQKWTQIVVAGLGAMALFRSALFNVRIGDNDVPIGPSSILQIFVDAVDRDVDRTRGQARIRAMADIMKDVSFEKAVVVLPSLCLALMQNVSSEVQTQLGNTVSELAALKEKEPDRIKALQLGLALMNVVGENVVRAAVEELGEMIRPSGSPGAPLTDAEIEAAVAASVETPQPTPVEANDPAGGSPPVPAPREQPPPETPRNDR